MAMNECIQSLETGLVMIANPFNQHILDTHISNLRLRKSNLPKIAVFFFIDILRVSLI